MDAQTKEVLESIIAKDQTSLSDEEIQFLMARRSYLNDADRARFADLIKAHEESLKPKKTEVTAGTPAKK